ncbi:hypothetical protein [Streptomyces spongiae]|uniref:hypothetical protein n=1 Tax=Streptomyces spongiae TaxID=565072 RepID=UPI001883603C|nr:hypothetical protein [Streptomyces spongiae]
MTDTHLLVREQRHRAEQAAEPLPRPEDFPAGRFSLRTHAPTLVDTELLQTIGSMSLISLAALSGGMFPTATPRVLAEELSEL